MSEVNNDFLEYGASFLVTKRDYDLYYSDPDSLLGAGGQRFIAPSNQMDQLLIVANGDIGIIEEGLGIETDKWAGYQTSHLCGIVFVVYPLNFIVKFC